MQAMQFGWGVCNHATSSPGWRSFVLVEHSSLATDRLCGGAMEQLSRARKVQGNCWGSSGRAIENGFAEPSDLINFLAGVIFRL
jgi:hypothetical protein